MDIPNILKSVHRPYPETNINTVNDMLQIRGGGGDLTNILKSVHRPYPQTNINTVNDMLQIRGGGGGGEQHPEVSYQAITAGKHQQHCQ